MTSRPFPRQQREDHVVDPFPTEEIALHVMSFLPETQRAHQGYAGYVAGIHRPHRTPIGPLAERQVEQASDRLAREALALPLRPQGNSEFDRLVRAGRKV